MVVWAKSWLAVVIFTLIIYRSVIQSSSRRLFVEIVAGVTQQNINDVASLASQTLANCCHEYLFA